MGLKSLILASSVALHHPVDGLQINPGNDGYVKEERACKIFHKTKNGVHLIIQTCHGTYPLYGEGSFPDEECENINDSMRSCTMPELIMHDY